MPPCLCLHIFFSGDCLSPRRCRGETERPFRRTERQSSAIRSRDTLAAISAGAYRPDGQVSKQEAGTVDSQSDAHWAAFAPLETVDIGYSTSGRPLTWKLSGGTAATMTQVSYDTRGRPECSAVRMNTAVYGSLPSSACVLTTQGSFGPDLITKAVYDAASQVTQVQVRVGTTEQANVQTLTYTANGRLQTLTDGEINKTTYEYDGHHRLSKTRYPATTKGANTSSTTDYEQLTYDANSNVIAFRNRAIETLDFTYDALNRLTWKSGVPVTDVNYAYDNLGRLRTVTYTSNGQGTTNSYDALGRLTSSSSNMQSAVRTTSYEYDLAGRRTKLTYPNSGLYVNYDYLVTGETTKIRENGATSGIGVLATYGYDNLGRRTSLTFGNGTSQVFGYDAISRLSSLTANLTGTANDLTVSSIAYNPAGQITSQTRSNDAYAWTGSVAVNRPYTSNGLNQLTQSGPFTLTYTDDRGNLTSDGSTTYTYDSENMLLSASGATSASMVYDPLQRLYQVTSGTAVTRFAYDGLDLISEYDASQALQRRYVHGPGMDQPIVWYEGTGTTDRRFLHADERGSVIATTDGGGNLLAANSYDEYGIPGSGNIGRFQYTGQAWLPELGLYHYKARIYSPTLGRFFQTDPIGYGDGMNMYAYVRNDPINLIDPLGLRTEGDGCEGDTAVCGIRGDPAPGGGRGGINSLTQFPWLAKKPGLSGFQCPVARQVGVGTKTEEQAENEHSGWEVFKKNVMGYTAWLSSDGHNDTGDAIRHFMWSFAMTRSMGAQTARDFTDGHEVSVPNLPSETKMDVHNNLMGRMLATDPAFEDLTIEEAAAVALASGCLQTSLE